MVEAEGVSRGFPGVRALDRVSLRVKAGEVFGLLGPNGAGKTTLVRILAGVLPPEEGRVRVAGRDLRDLWGIKARIGYVAQEEGIYRQLSVWENLFFRAQLYLPRAEARVRAQASLERFGLKPWASRPAAHLSGGWRRRLALAQAVVHQPLVLFLDEPTAGLDPLARREIWDLVHEEARRGVAVLVTTHYMDEAERCHRLALLFRGRILAQGTPAELKALVPGRAGFFLARGTDLEAVRARPGVLDAWPSGDGVRLILAPGAEPPSGSLPVEPSLEDVFLLLIREEA